MAVVWTVEAEFAPQARSRTPLRFIQFHLIALNNRICHPNWQIWQIEATHEKAPEVETCRPVEAGFPTVSVRQHEVGEFPRGINRWVEPVCRVFDPQLEKLQGSERPASSRAIVSGS